MEIDDFYGMKAYVSLFDASNMPTVTRLNITDRGMGIPIGIYDFIEFFCVDPDCDCRKVSIKVMNAESRATVASIHYGWESEEFYIDWFGGDGYPNPLEGFYLEPMQPQSKYANSFLNFFERILDL